MNWLKRHLRIPILVVALAHLVLRISYAQKSVVLPPQQHKILWADTVYWKAIATNDSLLLAESYYLYGKAFDAAGDFLTSQRWFIKSLAIIEPRGDSENLARLYRWLTGSGFRQGDYAKATKYAKMALEVAQRIKSKPSIAMAYGAISGNYARDWSEGGKRPNLPKSNPDSVNYYWKLNESFFEKSKKPLDVLNHHMYLGQKLWYEKKDVAGISHLKKALELATGEELAHRGRVMMELAAMYVDMGNNSQSQYWLQEARQFLSKGTYANSYQYLIRLESISRDYYLKRGDWRRAFDHSMKLHELERSNYIADRDGAVTRLGVEYETEKRETLLKSQQKELTLRSENLRVQQRFIATMVTLLIITVGMSFVFFRLYRKNQRISIRNEELVKEQNHRVKNNLQVVSSLLNLQANRLADETARKAVEVSQLRIETMAILHRRLYDNDTLAKVDLADYIPDLIENVLHAFGFGYVQPNYELEPIRLSADQALPVGLLLNELATNACKYAFPDHTEPLFRVFCRQKNNRIHLEVADNGPGIQSRSASESGPKTHQSFGMRLIQIQVAQLRGTYALTNQNGCVFTLYFSVSA